MYSAVSMGAKAGVRRGFVLPEILAQLCEVLAGTIEKF